MVWLKACPRCQGDLFLEQDHYGKFKTCLQCGYARDLAESVSPTAEPPRAATGAEGARLDLMAATRSGD
jgi:hypothetical protein